MKGCLLKAMGLWRNSSKNHRIIHEHLWKTVKWWRKCFRNLYDYEANPLEINSWLAMCLLVTCWSAGWMVGTRWAGRPGEKVFFYGTMFVLFLIENRRETPWPGSKKGFLLFPSKSIEMLRRKGFFLLKPCLCCFCSKTGGKLHDLIVTKVFFYYFWLKVFFHTFKGFF